jgi:hypothetical protein
MRKHLRALGASLAAALGLMAFFAVAAEAENLKDGGKAGSFTVLGSGPLAVGAKFTGKLEALTGTELVHGVLLVPGRSIQILCSTAHVTEGKFISSTEALVVFEYLECLTFNTGGEHIANCKIDDPSHAGADDRIILGKAILLPKLHEDSATHTQKLFVLFEPDASEVFTVILYEKGKGCVLPHENKIGGSFVAEAKEIEEGKKWLLTSNEATQKLFQVNLGGSPPAIHGDRILFGAFDSYIDANEVVELIGAHVGCKFAIV